MRSYRSRASLLAVTLLAAAVGAVPMQAQAVAVSGVARSARHPLLTEPLLGGGAAVHWARAGGGVTYRIGVTSLRGHADRIGIPCAGLVRPGTCAPEGVRDASRFTDATAGAALRLVGGTHAVLALTADATVASVHVDTRGHESGRTLRAAKALWGASAGLLATWMPAPRVPMGLQVAAGASALVPFVTEQISDGYTPFNDGVRLADVRLGVVWKR